MHGRPRKSPKPEDDAASAAKAEKLRSLQSQFLFFHHQKIYTKEAVELSAKLLETNPEYYTAWNYRKLAVENRLATRSETDPDSVNSILDEELRVVECALRQNFKAYGAWHHRKWVLSKGHSSIEKELRLLDKFQSLDSRNFHAWNYRRFVAALMERSEEDELDYTQSLIDKNFSNYSAWHNRSVLLSKLMRKKVQGFSQKEEVLTREYELVRDALFTDEDDQSGWFYHLWLLDQTVKSELPKLVSSWPANGSEIIVLGGGVPRSHMISPFNTFCSDCGTFPLVLYFSQAVEGISASTITVESGWKRDEVLTWKPLSLSNSCSSQVWVTQLKYPKEELHSLEVYSMVVTIGHSQGIISSNGLPLSKTSQMRFTVQLEPVLTETTPGSVFEQISWCDEKFHMYKNGSATSNLHIPLENPCITNELESTASRWLTKIISEEVGLFRDLIDCKIGKLTLARLLTAQERLMSHNKSDHSEVLSLYKDLIKLDPTHCQYYRDEHSLVFLRTITSNGEALFNHCFCYGELASPSDRKPICLRLNKLSLSRIGSFERLLWVQMLDLSQNELRSLEGLEAMQLLTYLCLSKNKLKSFTALEPVKQLKLLKTLDISHNEIGAHSIDTTRYLCSSPLSHSVGNEWGVPDGINLSTYWEAFFVLKGLSLTQLDVAGNPIADGKFTSFLVKVLPALKWVDGVQLH